MKNKKPFFKSNWFGLKIAQGMLLLLLLDAYSALAQTASEYKLTWDINVGCQLYSPPKPRDGEDPGLFVDDIQPTDCIRVCESATVTYKLTGDLSGTPNVQWMVTGGTHGTVTNTTTTSSIPVTWGEAGMASIAFTMNTPTGGTITKTLCIEIIKKPQANFFAYPMENIQDTKPVIYACVAQPIVFTDTSTTNGGSAIVDHYWTFGDHTFSAEQDPTHIYNEPGNYTVELTITNECGCKSSIKRRVIIKNAGGYEISCPSVVCEGQTSTYTLPFDREQVCDEYNFEVQGGEMVNLNNGSVTVTWNHVDASGFGIVTFNPNGHCHLECLIPTSIRIPVIQTNGTITGNNTICFGQQERYQLPQWPATDFQWSIQGSTPSNPLATLILTDQPNEIIVQPYQPGILVLVCNYQNTFLHCGGTAIYTIHVNSPEIINGLTNLCIGSGSTYTTLSNDNVDWTLTSNGSVVSGGTAFNTNSFSYNFTAAGNYSLTVSGPDVCDNQSISITVNPVPPVVASSSIISPYGLICPGAPYNFSVSPANPNMDYTWTITGGTIIGSANDPEVNVKFNQTGPYFLHITQQIKGQPSCVSAVLDIPVTLFTIDATISDNSTTYAVTSNNLTACANTEKTYYAVNTTGTPTPYTIGETYTWSIIPSTAGSITTGQGNNAVNVLWNNVTATSTAQLIVRITKCTRDSQSTIAKTVDILPKRTLTLTAPSACSGSLITMTLSSNIAIPVGTQIHWDYGDGNEANQIVAVASTNITRSYIYYTNPSGPANFLITASLLLPASLYCSGDTMQTKNIIITPGPIADISQSGPNQFCTVSGINLTLTTANTGIGTVIWYKAPNTQLPVGTGNNTSLTITPALGAGKYFYRFTSGGCTSQSNAIGVYVTGCGHESPCTITPYPALSLTNLTSCNSLSAQASASFAPTAGISYWSVIGPDASNNIMDTPGSGTATETYTTTINNVGTYHILYKGLYNCTDGTAQIVQAPTLDITVPYLANFTTQVNCSTSNVGAYDVTLTSTSSFMASVPLATRNYFYFWSHTPTGPWTAINATSAASVVFNQSATETNGDYYFKLVVSETTNAYSPCEKISDYISLAPDPVRNITVQSYHCYNDPVTFGFDIPNSADVSYLWTFDTTSGLPLATLATNTLENPSRVFDELATGLAHNVTVTVAITNRYGCVRTLSKIVTIPARCYYGDISTSTTSICKGGSIVLNYTAGSHADNCTVSQYQWMEGTTQIGSSASPTYTVTNVTGTKFYWVRLVNASQCVYNCAGRISPTYKPMPTLQLSAPSIVCYSGGIATATVGANTSIQWYVDTVLQPNTSTSLALGNFPIGIHTLSVVATLNNGCSKSVSQSFTVKTPPADPTVNFDIDCATYKVTLSATPPAGGTGTLTWSSGTIGNPTTVYHGGPYMVTYNDGSGCPSYAQLDVPNSLDKYLWIFPSGCYNQCDNNLGTLIGPNVPVTEWNWLLDDHSQSSGTGMVQPYQPAHSGTYNLLLNNGFCAQESAPMNLNVTECKTCEFKKVTAEVKCITDELYQYNMIVYIDNAGAPAHVTISVPGNQVILNPTAFPIDNGPNTTFFSAIPINGFVSGTVHMILTSTDERGEICTYEFDVKFVPCPPKPRKVGEKAAVVETTNSLLLYPNPAHGEVTALFDIVSDNAEILIYDLTGKQLASYTALNKKGSINLNIAQLASGIYVVVLKEDGQTTLQKKLVVE